MGEKGIENEEEEGDEEEISLEDLPSKIMDLEDDELESILKRNGKPARGNDNKK